MKKQLAILMIFFAFLNIFGMTAFFYISQTQIQSEMKKLLKSKIPIEKLELIKVPKNLKAGLFKRVKNHEIRFRGKMYDIFKEYVANDTMYFYCVNDTKEEKLFSEFGKILGNEKSPYKNLTRYFTLTFFAGYFEIKDELIIENKSRMLYPEISERFKSLIFDIPTPPPELI